MPLSSRNLVGSSEFHVYHWVRGKVRSFFCLWEISGPRGPGGGDHHLGYSGRRAASRRRWRPTIPVCHCSALLATAPAVFAGSAPPQSAEQVGVVWDIHPLCPRHRHCRRDLQSCGRPGTVAQPLHILSMLRRTAFGRILAETRKKNCVIFSRR